jgi:hypothetical protein
VLVTQLGRPKIGCIYNIYYDYGVRLRHVAARLEPNFDQIEALLGRPPGKSAADAPAALYNHCRTVHVALCEHDSALEDELYFHCDDRI